MLSGQGTTVAESGEIPIVPGDIVLIPAGEKHMTRNTGNVPLVLLCFFPVPDVSGGTVGIPELLNAWPSRFSACGRRPISRGSMRCRRLADGRLSASPTIPRWRSA